MIRMRLCDLVIFNPPVREFDVLPDDHEVSFLPMEGVWPDALQLSSATKKSVESGYTRFREGDLLLPKITPTFSHGRSSLAVGLLGGLGAGTTELHVLRPREGVSARWLYYVTKSHRFLREGEATLYGVAGQKRISTTWLHDYSLDVPDPQVQVRIARWLDEELGELDHLLAELITQRSLIEERDKQAVLRLVTGRDVLGGRAQQGAWWMGDTPVSWQPLKIAHNYRTGSGTTPKSGEARYYDGEHAWLTTTECRDEVVYVTAKTVTDEALADYSALKFYPAGSIVVAMYGATIGKLAMLGESMTVNQACCILYSPSGLDTEFTYWWLWAHRQELVGLGVGGGQPNISQEIVRQLVVPAPTLAEQQRIVGQVRELRQQSEHMLAESDKQVELLNERKTAIITAAVSGQMEVA